MIINITQQNVILVAVGAVIGILITLLMHRDVIGPSILESAKSGSCYKQSSDYAVTTSTNLANHLSKDGNVKGGLIDERRSSDNSDSYNNSSEHDSPASPDAAESESFKNQDMKLIHELSAALKQKLDDASKTTKDMELEFKSCKDRNITNYDDTCTCKAKRPCLKTSISENLDDRIKSLVFPPNMRIPNRYWDILEEMRNKVEGNYDLVIVHAMSANHFNESQGLLESLHYGIFPLLSNYKLIVYELGDLSDQQRDLYAKYCKCSLVKFPFEKLPDHFKNNLRTFSWKVFTIAAHYEQAQLLMWLDSSIRFNQPQTLLEVMGMARERGVQQRSLDQTPNPERTLPQMFEAFGDSPCAHASFKQCETGFGIYHNEPLIRHALIKPWVACASNPYCMAPRKQRDVDVCPDFQELGPLENRDIGVCMRSDQSAITIILAKLFREKMLHYIKGEWGWQTVWRHDDSKYFENLEKMG